MLTVCPPVRHKPTISYENKSKAGMFLKMSPSVMIFSNRSSWATWWQRGKVPQKMPRKSHNLIREQETKGRQPCILVIWEKIDWGGSFIPFSPPTRARIFNLEVSGCHWDNRRRYILMITSCFCWQEPVADKWMNAVSQGYFLVVTENIVLASKKRITELQSFTPDTWAPKAPRVLKFN